MSDQRIFPDLYQQQSEILPFESRVHVLSLGARISLF